MEIDILFRKKGPLADDGMPWISGGETSPIKAVRNSGPNSAVSAILARALATSIDGHVTSASSDGEIFQANVASRKTGGSMEGFLSWKLNDCSMPFAGEGKITYVFGVLGIIEALVYPNEATDFWEAYAQLLDAYLRMGKSSSIKPQLIAAADELYFWIRYRDLKPVTLFSRLESLKVSERKGSHFCLSMLSRDIAPLTDLEELTNMRLRAKGIEPLEASKRATTTSAPIFSPKSEIVSTGFVGWQTGALEESLAAMDNILLAGPTGTGKTYALTQVVGKTNMRFVSVEGKEGLTDLDFLGAILPHQDGSRKWVDGPLLRAMRFAIANPVLLFLDEVNRIPRPFLNILLGLMNPKTGDALRQMGVDASGDGPFYMVEAPMTSEIVTCPAANLRIVAAGNFGRAYQVYDLDPAVRRRFDTVIEFDYLNFDDEKRLLMREFPAMPALLAEVMVKVAQETRRLMANGELPGCIDTASLIGWAKKCARHKATTNKGIMDAAELTWADTVCGRDHTGRVNQGAFKAIDDYIVSLGTLK